MSKPKIAIEFEPLTADVINDHYSIHTFFSRDELMEEWWIIRNAITQRYPSIEPLPLTHRLSYDEKFLIAQHFSTVLPFVHAPSSLQISSALDCDGAHLPMNQIPVLLLQLLKLSFAIGETVDDHSVRTFVVPHLWHQRWDQLLSGALYPAHVGFCFV